MIQIRSMANVLAVLGHCVGLYAAAIAEAIAHWQPAPEVILFDLQVVTAHHLLFCVPLGDQLGELPAFQRRARSCSPDRGRNPGIGRRRYRGHRTELAEGYFEVVAAAFERAGLGDASVRVFEAHLRWLPAACRICAPRRWQSSTIIASSAYDGRPDGAAPVSGDGAGRLVPLDVPPADLLRSDSAARTVLDLLESGSHPRPPAGRRGQMRGGIDVSTGDGRCDGSRTRA